MQKENVSEQEQENAAALSEERSEFDAFLAEVIDTAREQNRQPAFVFPTRYTAHELTVDKVSFRVFSQFNGDKTLDKLLASLMLEDVNRPQNEQGV